MNNFELIGFVLLACLGAISGSMLVCFILWVFVDRCENFSKNPWDTKV